MSKRPLRVLSIAHTAISRETGRLRYHPFAAMPDFEVHLLAPSRWRESGRGLVADAPADPGVIMHIEPVLLQSLPWLKWYGHFYRGLGRIVKTVQADVIHLWEEPWSIVALQAARLRGNAALVLEVDQNILKRLPPPFEAIRRYVLRRTDLILSRSPDASEVVRACGFEGPARSIGYGVDQAVFRPAHDAEAPAPAEGRALRLGYVGRLIEEKGLDDALVAMKLAHIPAELAIMGEGPYERQLRRRVLQLGLGARVSFRGWGSASEVAGFIGGCDVTLLLTRTTAAVREQFGRAIIESQACGVPVIGSTCGAIPDVVAEGGWIVPESDPGTLAELLNRLQAGPGEIPSRRAAGLKNVAARFTYPAVAHALGAAWSEADVLNRQSRVPSPVGAVPDGQKTAGGFRIVQAVQEFSTEGGAETVAFELAMAWDRAGVPNSVLASAAGCVDGTCKRLERVAPWLARIPTRGPARHFGRLFVVPIFTLAATLALRKHRDAVIVSHGDTLAGDVLVVHAVNAVNLKEKRRAGNWKWLFNPIHLWVALRDRFMIGGKRYRKYVAVSPRVAGELETYYKVPPRLISVIPNGIDLDKFKANPAMGRAIRSEFGIPPEARLLLFVSHEFDRKGLAFAVEALKLLDGNVRLLAVGSDDPAPYRRLLPDGDKRLIFAGARKDLPGFYAAADVFVLPTAYETFSLVCMEALASGVPVLATKVGGIEDYLKDGVNGYGIARDPADIAAKVRVVLGDPAHLAALMAGARATAERFDWNTVAARYAVLLKEIWEVKNGSRAPASALCLGGPAHTRKVPFLSSFGERPWRAAFALGEGANIMSGATKLRNIPAFDGFRGVGVLAVIFAHLPMVLDSRIYNTLWQVNQASRFGYIALDIFFSISGFFITRLLLAERAKTGRISFKNFYTRRALRIFPIYYLTVGVCFFVFSFNASETLSLLAYTFNIYHPLHPVPNPLEHSWSLSVEEQFYFLWPFLIATIPMRSASFVAGRVMPALAILSGFAIALLTPRGDQTLAGNLVYMLPLTRMLSLSLGAWLAVREFENRPLYGWPCAILAALAPGLLLLDFAAKSAGVLTSQGLYWTIALISYGVLSLAFTATVVFDNGRIANLLRSFLSIQVLRGCGRISYGLYLYHLPVLYCFGLNDAAMAGGKAPIEKVAAAVLITLLIGIASYYAIERPLLSRRSKPARKPAREADIQPAEAQVA